MTDATFYTAANADVGLAPSQRRLLEPHARIVDVPAEVAARPYRIRILRR